MYSTSGQDKRKVGSLKEDQIEILRQKFRNQGEKLLREIQENVLSAFDSRGYCLLAFLVVLQARKQAFLENDTEHV